MPERIVLDLYVADLPLHGHQEGRFFHGYYDSYCYLPLYIFCGEHLLCARLRTADQDAAAGSRAEVDRIVGQIRQVWPSVQIIVRADSGFCRLVYGLRRLALAGTELACAQATTIRRQLLKIGAQIRVTTRKVWISLASSFPYQALFIQAWQQLRC